MSENCYLKDDILSYVNNGKKLFRIDGKVNSPLIKKFMNTELYTRLIDKTNFLPKEASFSQRWWHIKNAKMEYKKCICGNDIIEWRKKYCDYCSQRCATTCDEARERARKGSSGRKLTKKQRDNISNRQIGTKRSKETKELLSFLCTGNKNHRSGKIPWNKGLFGASNPNFGKKRPHANMPKGVNNKQFGKSPSHASGYGIYGLFNGVHFRSSLELFYLIYWHERYIGVESAEQEAFRMTYFSDGKKHTYTPDFYLYDLDTIVEIKPECKQEDNIVQIKFYTLKYFYEDKKCLLLGYKDIGNFIVSIISSDRIDSYLGYCLVIKSDQLQRLKRNYGDILREVRRYT